MRLILSYTRAVGNPSFASRPHPLPPRRRPALNLYAVLSLLAPAADLPASKPIVQQLERDWQQDILEMLRDRLPKALIGLLVLFILERIMRFFVQRMQRLALRPSAIPGRSAQLRTMAAIVRATSLSVLGFLAFLQFLNLLNIRYEPLLASAGIVGVGIGLAAQSLFKDIINGVLILVEDQYNVGEIVRIASFTGTVEDLTLRLTRLRDGDGTLYVIPNSQVAVVSNLSRDYSLGNLTLSVDVSANPDLVIATLKEITAEVRRTEAFQDVFLEDPRVVGVDRIEGRAIQYPIVFRVRPNQKDDILRALRRQIILTFEQKGIPFGIDAATLFMQATGPPEPPSASGRNVKSQPATTSINTTFGE